MFKRTRRARLRPELFQCFTELIINHLIINIILRRLLVLPILYFCIGKVLIEFFAFSQPSEHLFTRRRRRRRRSRKIVALIRAIHNVGPRLLSYFVENSARIHKKFYRYCTFCTLLVVQQCCTARYIVEARWLPRKLVVVHFLVRLLQSH